MSAIHLQCDKRWVGGGWGRFRNELAILFPPEYDSRKVTNMSPVWKRRSEKKGYLKIFIVI
jgi:hypothetical protein